ncbi:hypothetical protein BDA96_05G110600 [Sorghum bicolor]|uniref:Uncharacterized protein n=1 Tax=Sorghum bicolor TaxID=4558 RepID=A0A921QXR9_SORBI|nr:hypothetical protein BDA96_05G110600 [Sorghum bicolor]
MPTVRWTAAGGPRRGGPARRPQARQRWHGQTLVRQLRRGGGSDPVARRPRRVQRGRRDRGEVVRLRRASWGGWRGCVEAIGCVERRGYEEAAWRRDCWVREPADEEVLHCISTISTNTVPPINHHHLPSHKLLSLHLICRYISFPVASLNFRDTSYGFSYRLNPQII